MLSKRLAAVAVLAILPVFGQVSNAVGPSTDKIARHQHGPIRDLKDHHDSTSSSTNWSGYAVLGTAFTSAKASWVVPAAKCPSGTQYAAFWVGLDGYSSKTVEQTGTDSDCDGARPSYYAWYEFYPQPSIEIGSLSIKPGDNMSASVTYSGSEFTVTITDQTTGKSFSKSSTVSGAKRSSAEWIAEAPCCTFSGGILPLADFGTVLFGEDSTGVSGTNYATDSTTSGPIGDFSIIEEITMARKKSGKLEAVPSALSSDGTSFSVTWDAK
jgi:hypothetical protein